MKHTTSATGQHDFPGGFSTGPGQHHCCTIELLLLFLIVYTGHFNCTWEGGGSFIVSYEQCDYTQPWRSSALTEEEEEWPGSAPVHWLYM
jgi:hypothetical protein